MQALSGNANVERCSERSITYGKDFKINAVKLYKQGLSSRDIFRQAGFDPDMIGKRQPKDCIRRWIRIWKAKGEGGLSAENRGGQGRRRNLNNLNDADKIKRMEAEIAYLKAENDFLAKLRAGRAE